MLPTDETASLASVHDPFTRTGNVETHGTHEPAAWGSAIARVDVDMLRVEAVWAVIRVAVSRDARTASFTSEVFYFPGETHGMR